MKGFTIILSLLILGPSVNPCSDDHSVDNQHIGVIDKTHSNHQNSSDTCPFNCICNCCGISIAFEPMATYGLGLRLKISTVSFYPCQSHYRFDFMSAIWQPPKLIS